MTLTNAESFDLFHQVVFPKGAMGHFSLTNNYFFGKTHLVYQLRRKGIGSGHVREMSVRVGWRDRVFGGTGETKRKPVSDNYLTQDNVQSVRNQLSPVK